jgi:hypothetical protein
MARTPAEVRLVRRTIKLSLHPVQHKHLIELIDNAPHKGRLVVDALEGRRQVEAPTPAPADDSDELREQLEGFLM